MKKKSAAGRKKRFGVWLKDNSEPIKTLATVIQSVAVVGGIFAAIYGFILSPEVEERERIRVTIPYLEAAYSEKSNAARDKYVELSYMTIEDKILVCGSRPGCIGNYSLEQLRETERTVSKAIKPLAHHYSVLARCIESKICSARAAYGYLCADATEKYFGIAAIRQHVLDRTQ